MDEDSSFRSAGDSHFVEIFVADLKHDSFASTSSLAIRAQSQFCGRKLNLFIRNGSIQKIPCLRSLKDGSHRKADHLPGPDVLGCLQHRVNVVAYLFGPNWMTWKWRSHVATVGGGVAIVRIGAHLSSFLVDNCR